MEKPDVWAMTVGEACKVIDNRTPAQLATELRHQQALTRKYYQLYEQAQNSLTRLRRLRATVEKGAA